MFSSACTNAREFTFPIIISSRQVNGRCSAGIGTFVIINEEGWIVTAWHIIQSILDLRNAVKIYNDILSKRKSIEDDDKIHKNEKRRLLNLHKISPEMVTHFSVLYGNVDWEIQQFRGIPEIDLAVGKIQNFKSSTIRTYPSFKDPKANMDSGSSLCKLGFPFHNIIPTFDEVSGSFSLPAGSLPVPLFPLEGIFTRGVRIDSNVAKSYPLMFVETSSPGLRGQSGGPTFDIHGNIWAIQSSTRHLKLGFGATSQMIAKEKDILENQYLHVGWGIHAETIIGFLTEEKIKFNLSK